MGEGTTGNEVLKVDVQVWREAMAQLRHLSNDVWKGLVVFLGLNAFLLTWVVGVLGPSYVNRWRVCVGLLLCALGILLTLAGRWVLMRHRIYYLQMLAKKTLIEHELRFYETKLADTNLDLAFPWRLTPEVVEEIRRNLEAWVQKSIRSGGTIARVQFCIYETVLALYGLAFLIGLIRLFR